MIQFTCGNLLTVVNEHEEMCGYPADVIDDFIGGLLCRNIITTAQDGEGINQRVLFYIATIHADFFEQFHSINAFPCCDQSVLR